MTAVRESSSPPERASAASVISTAWAGVPVAGPIGSAASGVSAPWAESEVEVIGAGAFRVRGDVVARVLPPWGAPAS